MTNNRTIGIVVFDDVLTTEVIAPAEVFGMASSRDWFQGGRVLLIGIEQQPTVRTQEGITLSVDCTIDDEVTLDVLFVPGSYDVSELLQNEKLNAFIREHEPGAEWVTSVCAGAFLLGNAGVLDGMQATTWHGGEADLQAQFPQINVVDDRPVVVDNRHITADGGLVAYHAALVLLAKLTSPEHAHEIYESLSMERLGSWTDVEAAL